MIDIMEDMHKYVPSMNSSIMVKVDDSDHTVEEEHIYPICFVDDQMSVAGYRGNSAILQYGITQQHPQSNNSVNLSASANW